MAETEHVWIGCDVFRSCLRRLIKKQGGLLPPKRRVLGLILEPCARLFPPFGGSGVGSLICLAGGIPKALKLASTLQVVDL